MSKCIKYAGDHISGMTPEGMATSTLLCFMVKSVGGHYKDIVVAIYPFKLTASKMHDCCVDDMHHKTHVTVVVISVDNAATNRKFYVDHLCVSSLTTSVVDTETSQPIFLIFDPVHTLKNVYSSFQQHQVFECQHMTHSLMHRCSQLQAHC